MHFIYKFIPYLCLSFILIPFMDSAHGYEARIVAHVDKRAITEKDLEDRISLIIFTSNQKNTPDMRHKMRKQVLDTMIIEQVKLKAAAESKVTVSPADIKKSITDIAQQNNMTYDQLVALFKANKISLKSLETRIKAQLAWDTIVLYGLPGGGVSEKEIDKVLEAEQNNKDMKFDVSEIVIFESDNTKRGEAKSLAQSILQQINNGANFSAMAQQFSQSATASRSGKMGVLSASTMPQNLFSTLQSMNTGDVKLIELDKGFQIVRLNQKIAANQSALGYVVDFQVVVIPFSEDMSEEDQYAVQAKIDALNMSASLKQFLKSAKDMGLSVKHVENFDLDSCPSPELAAMIQKHKVGDILKPIQADGGIQILYITKKTQKIYTPPTRKEIKQQLDFQKRNMTANMMLKKLEERTFISHNLDALKKTK